MIKISFMKLVFAKLISESFNKNTRHTKLFFLLLMFFYLKGTRAQSPVLWQTKYNTTSSYMMVQKSSSVGDTWLNSFALSNSMLPANQDGIVSFTPDAWNLSNPYDIKVSLVSVTYGTNLVTITKEHEAEVMGSNVKVIENEVINYVPSTGSMTIVTPGTTRVTSGYNPFAPIGFSIERQGSSVLYKVSGVTGYTSTVNPNKALYIFVQLYYHNGRISNISTNFAGLASSPFGSPSSCSLPTISSETNLNWTQTKAFDKDGLVKSISKQYFDEQGKVVQTQSSQRKDGLVFVSQPLYDVYGRQIGATLPAPKDNYTIQYKPDFITTNGTTPYSYTDFDNTITTSNSLGEVYNPKPVDNSIPGSLGWYYSANNYLEPYTPSTTHPYTRTKVFNEPVSDITISSAPGDDMRMGKNHEVVSATLLSGKLDLQHYWALRSNFVTNSTVTADNVKTIKEVSEDPDSKTSITYSDVDGNVLAQCLAGAGNNASDATKTYEQYLNKNQWYTTSQVFFHNVITGGTEPYLSQLKFTTSSTPAVNIYANFSFSPNTQIELLKFSSGSAYTKLKTYNSNQFATNAAFIDAIRADIEASGAISNALLITANKYFTYTLLNPYKISSIPFNNGLLPTIGFTSTLYNFVSIPCTPELIFNNMYNLDANSYPAPNSSSASYFSNMATTNNLNAVDIYLNTTTIVTVQKTDPTNCTVSDNIRIYNILQDNKLQLSPITLAGTSQTASLPAGFYRIESEKDQCEIKVSYSETTTNWSYNYYDDNGTLVAQVAPNGINQNNTLAPTFVDKSTYNSLGWVTNSTFCDENGQSRFLYRSDGAIRFSQNPQQAANGKFSYTNYDYAGRVVEIGEAFSNSGPDYFDVYLSATPAAWETDFTSGVKSDQSIYSYDKQDNSNPFGFNSGAATFSYVTNTPTANYKQRFLAGKISRSVNANGATWYSYDYQGRTEWVIQYVVNAGYKTINYTYDDFSSDLLKVEYNKEDISGTSDAFTHNYTYDCLDRLVEVTSSHIGYSPQTEAKYEYYKHGPLRRTELGGNTQGIDYTYTINGQLKSINQNDLSNGLKDPGLDGVANSSHAAFKQDAFGMVLQYYKNDYKSNWGIYIRPINTDANVSDYFNGNISAVQYRNRSQTTGESMYAFKYDHRNWMTDANYGTATFTGGVSYTFTAGNKYGEYGITYDPNGNIKTLKRNSSTASQVIDNLTYNYTANTNKLNYVADAGTVVAGLGDITNQTSTNYTYNNLGQLIQNVQDNQKTIYNAYQKVMEVDKTISGTDIPVVKFYYDALGNRIRKETFNYTSPTSTTLSNTVNTYYLNDIAGNTLSTYSQTIPAGNTTAAINQVEIPIYGAARVGMVQRNGATYTYLYELTDHLGNVRVTVPRTFNGTTLSSYADYYPFGWVMPGSNQNPGSYRYGYQGEYAEKDPETGLSNFELRMYESRLGRWMITDPYLVDYSSYMGMGNNPISNVDPDGGDPVMLQGVTVTATRIPTTPYIPHTIPLTPNMSDIDIRSTAQSVLDFIAGISNAFYANTFGTGYEESGSNSFKTGQTIGNAGSLVGSFFEWGTGEVVKDAPIVAAPESGGLSLVLAPAAYATGTAMQVHGIYVAKNAINNLTKTLNFANTNLSNGKKGKGKHENQRGYKKPPKGMKGDNKNKRAKADIHRLKGKKIN